MFLFIFWAALIVIFERAVSDNIWLFITLRWLNKNGKSLHLGIHKSCVNFILIIPVLREQKVLAKTIDHFEKFHYNLKKIKIIIVSTEKEFVGEIKKGRSTIDLINKIKEKKNREHGFDLIEHLHYPKTDGKLVDQLNFAFRHILSRKIDFKNTFIGIYNADSKPDLYTLDYISENSQEKNHDIFQQSALYFDNFKDLETGRSFIEEKILKANAVLQTRWTLAHELPRMKRQSFFINKYGSRFSLAHVVGHGLFLRMSLIEELKKIPDDTVNEDLFFGYILSLLKKPINPVPLLESAETPNGFLNSLKQKYVWFFGPLEYLDYRKYFLKSFPNRAKDRAAADWLSLQGLISAAAWFFSGWMMLYIIIYPLAVSDVRLFLLALGVFFIYGPLSYFIITVKYRMKTTDRFWLPFMSFPVTVVHSLPPIFSVLAKLNQIITDQKPSKPKTER